MEHSFEKDDHKQHGTLKHEDRKHEGASETRPERPLPAEAGKTEGDETRDENQPKVAKRDEEQDKKVKRDEEQPKVAADKDNVQTEPVDDEAASQGI